MILGETVYARFTVNCGDLIFENGDSPVFQAGAIVSGKLVQYTSESQFAIYIDWGCGQCTRIWAQLSKIELVPEMEIIALVAEGKLTLDDD